MLTVDNLGTAVVLRVAGDVDMSCVVELRNAIMLAIEEHAQAHVVVDVRDAHHLGPRGLALLVDEKAILIRRGGDLRLVCGVSAEPGLARLFHVHATVEEAVASLAA